MKFSSSPLLMFRDFLISIVGDAAMITLAAGILMAWLKPDIGLTDIPLCGIAVFLFFISIGGVAIGGRVTVEVTDDEVVITRPLEEPLRLPRAQWQFSSRVASCSVNFISVTTERILTARDDAIGRANEFVLSNLSKRSFDALMAALLRERALAEIAAEEEEKTQPEEETQPEFSFTVPQEKMFRDFRSMFVILAVHGAAFSVTLVVLCACILSMASTGFPAALHLAMAVGACLIVFLGIGFPLLRTLCNKRRRSTPAFVRLAGDSLEFGEERLDLVEIRRMVATNPYGGIGGFAVPRRVTIHGDRGSRRFWFGPRVPGGIMCNFVFAEYGAMCAALERTAARQGFEFAYDL